MHRPCVRVSLSKHVCFRNCFSHRKCTSQTRNKHFHGSVFCVLECESGLPASQRVWDRYTLDMCVFPMVTDREKMSSLKIIILLFHFGSLTDQLKSFSNSCFPSPDRCRVEVVPQRKKDRYRGTCSIIVLRSVFSVRFVWETNEFRDNLTHPKRKLDYFGYLSTIMVSMNMLIFVHVADICSTV